MNVAERDSLAIGVQPAIRNVARFIADYYVSLPALRAEFKSDVATDAILERRFRDFRSLWARTVHVRVTETSTAARSDADLYRPLLELVGFAAKPKRREIELDPEHVALAAYGEDDAADLLVDALPFGTSPDDRLDRGEFRGSAQRRMVRALAVSGSRFGVIFGAGRVRLVQLDTANEPRYLEFDLGTIVERDDVASFGVFATLVSPTFLLGESPQLAALVEKSDARGTVVSEALGPAARGALQALLEAVRLDERNAAWAATVFMEGESLRAIHQEGIYVLYRLLFVLFAEASNALPLDKPLYREAYSLERMRDDLSADVAFADNSYALWDGVKALFRLIDSGAQTDEFRIPAYNGGLFGRTHTLVLDSAWIADNAFATVLRELTTVRLGSGKHATRDRVSFRELGVAQLGAVFEGLLDYEPHIAHEDLFEMPTGTGKGKGLSFLPASVLARVKHPPGLPDVAAGHFYLQAWGGQRKATGAYYTPRVIADYLVREALRPHVDGKSSDAILEIAVCDPAMGSGGFLVSATEFLGDAYYRSRVAEGGFSLDDENADMDRISAKRIVAERCIYGVDANPMAVELAKVSLWLTTLSYDRPLSFFDHHLRCGNSLLGAPLRDDLGVLTSDRIHTVPSAALSPVDKEASKEERAAQQRVAKRNASQLKAFEAGGHRSLFTLDLAEPLAEYAEARKGLSADDPTQSAEDAVELVRAKERRLRELTEDPRSPFFKLKEIADLWMAPWFWPHDAAADANGQSVEPPTTDDYATMAGDIWAGGPRSERGQRILDESRRLARRLRFFHWEIEFPEVFERGGFHAIVGNPPWETLSPKTQEFFANYDPQFRNYDKQHAIKVISSLRRDDHIEHAFRRYARDIYQQSSFFRTSGLYKWLSSDAGGLDLFRIFVERDHRSLREGGHLAQVLKDSIYVNSSCSEVRQRLVTEGSVSSLIVNENRKGIFPIDSRIKVVLLVAERGKTSTSIPVAFFVGKDDAGNECGRSTQELAATLADSKAHLINVPLSLLESLSPSGFSIVEVRDRSDVALLQHFADHGVQMSSLLEIQYVEEINMTRSSHLFVGVDRLIEIGARRDGIHWRHPLLGDFWPVVEGKQLYQYECPVGDFRYWVSANEANKLPLENGRPVNTYPRLAWRNVARATDERTFISMIIPSDTFLGHSLQSVRGGKCSESILNQLMCVCNSFVFDWQMRVRGALHATVTLVKAMRLPRALPNVQSSDFSRAEIEASVMLAYELPFELAEHVMDGFPLLDRLQPALPGERRSTVSRDAVLACYADALSHSKASVYRDRTNRAAALGAKPFIPATRSEPEDADHHVD